MIVVLYLYDVQCYVLDVTCLHPVKPVAFLVTQLILAVQGAIAILELVSLVNMTIQGLIEVNGCIVLMTDIEVTLKPSVINAPL